MYIHMHTILTHPLTHTYMLLYRHIYVCVIERELLLFA